MDKTDIRGLSLPQLIEIFEAAGEKKFRARQVYQWLWQKGAHSFDEMTNLSKPLREYLNENYLIHPVKEDLVQKSDDGTIKCGFRLHEGDLIEGVLIPADKRVTACISSQIGCSLACKFCATGFLDLKRNLEASEIFDQVVLLNRQSQKNYDKNVSNIVFMGMGEPLLNYRNVLKAIELITSPDGLGMSARRITVSTAGIAKMIHRLAEDQVKFNLALSLHAPTDEKRNKIMAINEHNNIAVLLEALKAFYKSTQNRITYEYILFRDFNDSEADAQQLIKLCSHFPVLVNIIEFNPVEFVDYKKPSHEKVVEFAVYLEKHGITAKVRRSRGKDIDAACGQLANKQG